MSRAGTLLTTSFYSPEFIKLIKRIMRDEGEKPPSNHDLKVLFINADVDRGGSVDFDEVTELYAKIRKGPRGPHPSNLAS